MIKNNIWAFLCLGVVCCSGEIISFYKGSDLEILVEQKQSAERCIGSIKNGTLFDPVPYGILHHKYELAIKYVDGYTSDPLEKRDLFVSLNALYSAVIDLKSSLKK